MAKFIVRKRLPAAPAPKPMRSKSEGRMAPRMAMTMPKTKMPAQAEACSRATAEGAGTIGCAHGHLAFPGFRTVFFPALKGRA